MATNLIEEHLDQYFSKRDNSFWEPKDNIYHASTCGRCLRMTYYERKYGKKDNSGSYPAFWRGHKVEELVESALKTRYGDRNIINSVPIEIKLDGITIKGETDPVRIGKNKNIEELYEVKSIKKKFFFLRQREPSPDHIRQLHPYMKGLGLDSCELIYVSVPGFEEAHHTIEFDEELWEEIKDDMFYLNDCIINDILPDKQSPQMTKECFYCDYTKECNDMKMGL